MTVVYLTTTSNHQSASVLPSPSVSRSYLLDRIFEAYPSASVFTVTSGYLQPSGSKSINNELAYLPLPLTVLYDSKYNTYTQDDLTKLSEAMLPTLEVSEEQASCVEKFTKGQFSSTLWFEYCLGRLTASMFGKIFKCTEKVYPMYLVKSIMHYAPTNPNLPSLKWGRLNEARAKKQYCQIMKKDHLGFTLSETGTFRDWTCIKH